jgi:uncharacterized membrane protein YfcA
MSPLLIVALAMMPLGLVVSGLHQIRGKPAPWAEPLGLGVGAFGALIAAGTAYISKAPDQHLINLFPVIAISIGLSAMFQRRRTK